MSAGRPRDVPRMLRTCAAIAAILRDMHRAGVVHGRLDPGHVAVAADSRRVALMDFADAIAQSHVDIDYQHPTMLGHPLPFSAPEQTGRMGRAVDYRVDLHALGAILYWGLTGRPPFVEADPLALLHALLTRQPTDPAVLNTAVPPAVSRVVLKLLAKSPQDRYQSAHGALADLQRCTEFLETRCRRGDLRARHGRPSDPTRPSPRGCSGARPNWRSSTVPWTCPPDITWSSSCTATPAPARPRWCVVSTPC